MYHFKICNRIKLVCFLKFVVHKMNSKMVKSGIVVLTERERRLILLKLMWLWAGYYN
jgi:hypothetical protein